jgi:ubiquinone/menaquinone biosynthesis C-methylase UbiE
MIRSLLEEAAFRLSMSAHNGSPKGDLSHRPATFSEDKYDEWRAESLQGQFEAYFHWNLIRGKRVLDFGCGTGPLSLLCAEHGAASVTGIDLSAERIARARQISVNGHSNITFLLEEHTDRISLPDNSIDVIVCFDVMEHIMDYQPILREWARVLAPGGCVLIWWSVWWHPYGHHLHTMIPLPWVHVLMSDESLFRVCARIYDTPQFRPRIWHFDAQGNRKPNPYRGQVRFDDLNKLTISRFDQTVEEVGLQVRRKQVNPFTGSTFSSVKRWLANSPWPDFFCSSVVYELQRPTGSHPSRER